MAGIAVEPVTEALNLGKGPHWDTKRETLYFVDMFKGTIHGYNPKMNKFTSAVVGCGDQPMAIIVPVEGQENEFVVSLKNDLARIQWDGDSLKTSDPKVIQNLEPNDNNNRINNGKVDPSGRLWAGTTGRRLSDTEFIFEVGKAGLYMLKDSSTVSKLLGCVTIANGLEWSTDKTKFYFADSYKYQLEVYDYNDETGEIHNPIPIFNLKENKISGVFDGMAMDNLGRLYIANYNGCQVVVIDPGTGKIVNQIKIPAREVTSVSWGGPCNDILFVTTGRSQPTNCPEAGRVFKVTNLGAKGLPPRNIVLNTGNCKC